MFKSLSQVYSFLFSVLHLFVSRRFKMKRKILLFGIVFLMLCTLFVNPVMSASGQLTIEDWESYNVGANSGSGSYFTWFSPVDAEDIQLHDNNSGSKTLLHYGNTNSGTIYMNATTDLGYISSFSFYIEAYNKNAGGDTTHDLYIMNGSDEQLRVTMKTVGVDGFYYKANNGSWLCFAPFAHSTSRLIPLEVRIAHVTNNLMNYSLYWSDNNTLLGSKIGTYYGAGSNTSDWDEQTINQIKFDGSGSLVSNGHWYIDDIVIDTSVTGGSGGICDFSDDDYYFTGSSNIASYESWYRYLEMSLNGVKSWNITGFRLLVDDSQIDGGTSPTDYILNINDIPCGTPTMIEGYLVDGFFRYNLYWCGLSLSLESEPVVIEVSNSNPNSEGYYWIPVLVHSDIPNIYGYLHNTTTLFSNGAVDGGKITTPTGYMTPVFWVYYEQNTDNINNIEPFSESLLSYYVANYGNFFVEWRYTEDCHYIIGDYPELIVNITDENYSDSSGYLVKFKHLSSGKITYIHELDYPDTDVSGYIPINYDVFPYEGQYKLYVYNRTSSGGADELVYYSDSIMVCEYPLSEGETPYSDEAITENQIILGIMISMAVGIGLLLISHEVITFPAGFCISVWIFSQESLGSYHLLPSEVGVGLIVVLVLVGVIIWLLD